MGFNCSSEYTLNTLRYMTSGPVIFSLDRRDAGGHLGGHRGCHSLLATEDPHEEKLDDVGVHKEELCSSVALGAGDRVGTAGADGWVVGGIGKENVFEGSELFVG